MCKELVLAAGTWVGRDMWSGDNSWRSLSSSTQFPVSLPLSTGCRPCQYYTPTDSIRYPKHTFILDYSSWHVGMMKYTNFE